MKNSKPRIGIYGTVPPQTEVFSILVKILGYDPFTRQEAKQDAVIAPVCGRAKKFGPHFTLYDIFIPTDYSALIQKLEEIIRDFSPSSLTFSSFGGYVRGDYQNKRIYCENMKTVLALDFDPDSVEKLRKLHTAIIKNIQSFRDHIEPEFNKAIFQKVPALWQKIKKYGAPYVLENYMPHLTLASDLGGTETMCARIIRYLEKNYGAKLLGKQIPLDAVYIFEEILGGRLDGYFYVKDILKFAK